MVKWLLQFFGKPHPFKNERLARGWGKNDLSTEKLGESLETGIDILSRRCCFNIVNERFQDVNANIRIYKIDNFQTGVRTSRVVREVPRFPMVNFHGEMW